MNRQGVFLVCLLVVIAVGAQARKKSSRVVNGSSIDISVAPFTMQLRHGKDDYFICGGSLVTSRHVISAAHCIRNTAPTDMVVVGGATTKNDDGIKRKVIDHYVPDGYNRDNNMSKNDILILKLEKSMPINENIRTIEYCDSTPSAGQLANVYGWGKTVGRGAYNNVLNTVRIPIIDTAKCTTLYKDFAEISDSMICAGDLEASKDACGGDSGGPLTINGKLCGVVSWGRGCARPDSPGVYTSILHMIKFISESINFD